MYSEERAEYAGRAQYDDRITSASNPAPAFVIVEKDVQEAYQRACDVAAQARRIADRLLGSIPQPGGGSATKDDRSSSWVDATGAVARSTNVVLDGAADALRRIELALGTL